MIELIENTKDIDELEFINSFSHSGKPVKDLSRIKALLSDLGDPQDSLKFVHIAGTNGKGSMAQMFSEVFQCAGLKTGLFTSPYIISYTDRIKINGIDIPKPALAKMAKRVKAVTDMHCDRENFSQFEITTAIAFLYFAEENCDIVVLETGLGGLLDSTNVIKTPVLTVIGSVDFDHTAILGDTLEKIAYQKAGIIKPHCPCVLSAGYDMKVIRTVREQAVKNLSQLVIPDINQLKLISCDVFSSKFEFKGQPYEVTMGGAHQVLNAMSVISGIRLINDTLKIPQDKIFEGIKKAQLQGRVQILSREPLLILDGAHNPDGLSALAGVLEHCEKHPCYAVMGMCRDKNITEAVKKIIPYVDKFYTVDGFSDRAETASDLADIITNAGGRAEQSPKPALEMARQLTNENPHGVNLICGSLFLCAQVLNEMKDI